MSNGTGIVAVHQLICAHCTKETSALFRATGQGRHEVAGYSVRSTSCMNDVTEQFNRVRPFFQYRLPRDAFENGRRDIDESSAPRRLLYAKSNGTFLIGHVLYKKQDATGFSRGSYVAHFLLPSKELATCEVLSLWGATAWADSGVELELLPHSILPLQDVSELWRQDPGAEPLIDRTSLQSFLTEPRCSSSVVPARWRNETPEMRQRLLASVLQGLMSGLATERPLVVVAEPGFAALLFYGALQLLPAAGFASSLTFSTYEVDPSTANYDLTATCSAHLDHYLEVAQEVRAAQRSVVDTSQLSEANVTGGIGAVYAREAMRCLIDNAGDAFRLSWKSLAVFHDDFGALQSDGPRTLDCLAAMRELVRRVFHVDSPHAIQSEVALRSAIECEYRQRFGEKGVFDASYRQLLQEFRRGVHQSVTGEPSPVGALLAGQSGVSLRFVLSELFRYRHRHSDYWPVLVAVARSGQQAWNKALNEVLKDLSIPIEIAVTFFFFDKVCKYPDRSPICQRASEIRLHIICKHFRTEWVQSFFNRLIDRACEGDSLCCDAVELLLIDLPDEYLCNLAGTLGGRLSDAVRKNSILTQRFRSMVNDLLRSRDTTSLTRKVHQLEQSRTVLEAMPFGKEAIGYLISTRKMLALKQDDASWQSVRSVAEPFKSLLRDPDTTDDQQASIQDLLDQICRQLRLSTRFMERLRAYLIKERVMMGCKYGLVRFELWYRWKCLSGMIPIDWHQPKAIRESVLFVSAVFADQLVSSLIEAMSSIGTWTSRPEAMQIIGVKWLAVSATGFPVRCAVAILEIFTTQLIGVRSITWARRILNASTVIVAGCLIFRLFLFITNR